jgi:hypothetical protein
MLSGSARLACVDDNESLRGGFNTSAMKLPYSTSKQNWHEKNKGPNAAKARELDSRGGVVIGNGQRRVASASPIPAPRLRPPADGEPECVDGVVP